MVSKILQLINKEGLRVEEKDCFAMVQEGTDKYITIPKGISELSHQDAYSLAHELGHHLQYKNKPEWLILILAICRRIDKRFFFIAYLLIMLEELDAWRRAFKICRNENFNIFAFSYCAVGGILSYVKSWFGSIARLIKDLVIIYLTSVTVFKLGPFNIADVTIGTSDRLEALPILLQLYILGMFILLVYHSFKAFAGSVSIANTVDRK
jgi:hypothetical protein